MKPAKIIVAENYKPYSEEKKNAIIKKNVVRILTRQYIEKVKNS